MDRKHWRAEVLVTCNGGIATYCKLELFLTPRGDELAAAAAAAAVAEAGNNVASQRVICENALRRHFEPMFCDKNEQYVIHPSLNALVTFYNNNCISVTIISKSLIIIMMRTQPVPKQAKKT